MMSKPKYIAILTGLFIWSVVAGVLRTFTRFFPRKRFGKGWFFGMTTMAFGLGKPSPGHKWKLMQLHHVSFSKGDLTGHSERDRKKQINP